MVLDVQHLLLVLRREILLRRDGSGSLLLLRVRKKLHGLLWRELRVLLRLHLHVLHALIVCSSILLLSVEGAAHVWHTLLLWMLHLQGLLSRSDVAKRVVRMHWRSIDVHVRIHAVHVDLMRELRREVLRILLLWERSQRWTSSAELHAPGPLHCQTCL